MFKTIEQCRLDLVAHTVAVNHHDMVADEEYTLNTANVDYFPASAARVSFGKEDKTGLDPAADKKLMQYLADHEHMTPFEHQSATFLIEVPLFIRSQIMRHRTFAYNEISRRYTDENLEFWIPTTFRKQATNNRQASEGELDGEGEQDWLNVQMTGMTASALRAYEELIERGVCREQARAILPQSLLTKFFMTGNLRNWAHLVRLRVDAHAQPEVQVPAKRISAELGKLWPTAWGVLTNE